MDPNSFSATALVTVPNNATPLFYEVWILRPGLLLNNHATVKCTACLGSRPRISVDRHHGTAWNRQ